MKTYLLLTNDPARVIAVPSIEEAGDVQVIPLAETPYDGASLRFHALTNTLKAKAMREARRAAKAEGLRLCKPDTMFA